ncbi:hypothetical protein BDR03DRAFT_962682 [Suillus americanus]|nr:hypothetical protein BDR03DRAFT_962682 [Suillus americanus]
MESFSQAGSSTTHTTTSSPQHLRSLCTNVNLRTCLYRVNVLSTPCHTPPCSSGLSVLLRIICLIKIGCITLTNGVPTSTIMWQKPGLFTLWKDSVRLEMGYIRGTREQCQDATLPNIILIFGWSRL